MLVRYLVTVIDIILIFILGFYVASNDFPDKKGNVFVIYFLVALLSANAVLIWR